MSLKQLTEDLRVFAEEREWGRFHSPRNFAIALFNEAGELLAPYTWVNDAEALVLHQNPGTRLAIGSEVGDVLINILQFCRLAEIDVEAAAKGLRPSYRKGPKDAAMLIGREAGKLMARFIAVDQRLGFLNRDPHHRRDTQIPIIGQLYVEFLAFCELVELNPLQVATVKLEKLRKRFPAEEQKAIGGYVRFGEDGTPREAIGR